MARANAQQIESLASSIKYANDTQPTEATRDPAPPEPREQTAAEKKVVSSKVNDEAARRALESLRITPPARQAPPEVHPLTAEAAEKKRPEHFRVLERAEVARSASRFTLQAGKIINSNEYDIDDLKSRGVKLQPVPAPTTRA